MLGILISEAYNNWTKQNSQKEFMSFVLFCLFVCCVFACLLVGVFICWYVCLFANLLSYLKNLAQLILVIIITVFFQFYYCFSLLLYFSSLLSYQLQFYVCLNFTIIAQFLYLGDYNMINYMSENIQMMHPHQHT